VPGTDAAPLASPLDRPAPRLALAKRIGSGVVFIPLFYVFTRYAPLWAFSAFVVLLGAVGQWEFTAIFRRAGAAAYPWAGLAAGVLVTGSFALEGAAPWMLTLVVAGLLGVGLAHSGEFPPRWEGVALTLLGVSYVNWLLGHAILLRTLPQGADWIFLLVWVTWVGESTAYLIGSTLGRHRLAPRISPRKTIEGAVAQLAVSPLASLVARWWFFPECALRDALVVGLLLGVVGQLGDLAESWIKRSARTKDTGSLIPGHGGLLDRLDSLLFNTPALFYYARFVASP
jgi:phosphatidate cytidylyltransferase